MTVVHTLASGSSGNALVILSGGTRILLDAGISCRRIAGSLSELGLGPGDLDAILITHTHTDHISGLRTLLKRTDAPVRATERTCRGLLDRLPEAEDRLCQAAAGTPFEIGSCTVTAVGTSHDAPGACGYRLDTVDGSVGVLTDTGYVTEQASELLCGVDLAVLEANHDVETLCSGPYPYYLKQRILGPEGHLSNGDAAAFAVTLAERGAAEIVLAHLSRENNTPAMARAAVERALAAAGAEVLLSVAPRDTLGPAHALVGRAVCRR